GGVLGTGRESQPRVMLAQPLREAARRLGARVAQRELRGTRRGERCGDRRADATRTYDKRPRALHFESLAAKAAHEAFAVEEIALQAAVRRATHGVARAGDLHRRACLV